MRGYILLLLLLLVLPAALAADQVVINSKDWHDVYSGLIYARLNNLNVHYITEETQGIQLIEEVFDRSQPEMLLIESTAEPFIFGYDAKLEEEDFKVEKLFSSNGLETNLELAQKVASERNINKFIVVDGSLGYDALSVAPYALLTQSFVLFADRTNKDDLAAFLRENAQEIMLYGRLNREVKEKLTVFNPQIINTGDRYGDNLEIVKKFLNESPTQQVFLTHGEILERGFFNNEFPLLFVGTSNVPENVVDFIKDTDIRVGVVIGYELFANAKRIKELTGIKILLKYGQGRNSELYALDIIHLPSYSPQIDLKTIRYNTKSKQLEVVYENTGEVYTYVQALAHDVKANGISVASVGDEEAFFLNEGDLKTRTYNLDLTEYLNEELFIESKVVFGESTQILTKLLVKELVVEIIAEEDHSQIEILSIEYNKKTKRFEIIIKNKGKEVVYADPEIVDLIIDEEKVTLGGEQQKIEPGRKETFKIKALLEEVDFEDNSKVKVQVRYGAQPDVLLKSLTKEFTFRIKKYDYKPILFLVIILILIKILFSLRKRRW